LKSKIGESQKPGGSLTGLYRETHYRRRSPW